MPLAVCRNPSGAWFEQADVAHWCRAACAFKAWLPATKVSGQLFDECHPWASARDSGQSAKLDVCSARLG